MPPSYPYDRHCPITIANTGLRPISPRWARLISALMGAERQREIAKPIAASKMSRDMLRALMLSRQGDLAQPPRTG